MSNELTLDLGTIVSPPPPTTRRSNRIKQPNVQLRNFHLCHTAKLLSDTGHFTKWMFKIPFSMLICLKKSICHCLLVFVDRKRHLCNSFTAMLIYVDDMIITDNDENVIAALKESLHTKFLIKHLSQLRYFLGIEVACSIDGISISQRKYTLDILDEAGLLGAKPLSTPMEENNELLPTIGDLLKNPSTYRRLVRQLIYLTITRPKISYPVHILSQFMQELRKLHLDVVHHLLRLGSVFDHKTICDWILHFSWKSSYFMENQEIDNNVKVEHSQPTKLFYDSKATLHIVANLVYHERTKHIEIDCMLFENEFSQVP
ncbi:Retrovirus-related Pol polyprotein from transposon RE2 [Vitis vinifera]|uniref:Retrovirus-related Pol polyprotein from transposon RE2 n=1 Tax=Vitis vinifera TaxID=29760 RepID=A0A438BMM8_VITVI|nr:Retrovirus-related Pol polyprotein from transposon RE2 [Vitis vinifera]